MINSMALDVRALLRQAVEIAWFSRGSIQYETALAMSSVERNVVIEFINDRLEGQKKTMYPVY